MIKRALIAIALFSLTARVLADVIVVDPAGVGEPALEAAIAAAADGDILLLQPGDYLTDADGVVIDGKGLVLIADGGGTRPVLDFVGVQNVPAGSTVVIRGVELRASGFFPFTSSAALRVLDCDGAVWVEDSVLVGPPSAGTLGGAPGLFVYNSANVTIAHSTMLGGEPETAANCTMVFGLADNAGGDGAVVRDSQVSLHGCMLLGHDGGDPLRGLCVGHYADGGSGIQIEGSSMVLLAGSTLAGGVEGFNALSSTGGDAVRITGVAGLTGIGTAWLVDNILSPGPSFIGGPPTGEEIDATPDSIVADFATITARDMAISAPLREGEIGTLTFTGKQADLVGYFWSFTSDFLPFAGKAGVFAMGSPFQGAFVVGNNPAADGVWNLPFIAPVLPPGFDGLSFLLQMAAQDVDDSSIVIGGVTSFVLLDA